MADTTTTSTPAAPAMTTGTGELPIQSTGTQPAAPAQGAASAPATPAATPAATPTPAAGTPEPDATPDATEGMFGAATTYQTTGNENLDVVLKWAGQMGLDIDSSEEMQAAARGNFGPIKALLASKEVPGAEAYMALAEAAFRDMTAQREAHTESVQALVVQAAGSEEQWAEVFNWAAENADQAEKDQINYAFEQGGFLAEAVAQAMVSNYRQMTGASVPPQATPVKGTAAAAAPAATSGPLSPMDYAMEVQKLRLSMKGRAIEGSKEYQALQRRRMAFRGR